CVVDSVRIVSRTTGHRIRASPTVQDVVGGIADEHVVERIAGPAGRTTGQRQPLYVRAERITGAGAVDGVDTSGRILHNNISYIVDIVDIVAGPAHQRVGTCAAVEHVDGGIPLEPVAEGISRPVER